MPDGIKPLDEYLREIAAAERRLRTSPGLRTTAQDDQAKMLAYARAILDYYEGVQSQGSFIDAAGTVFDAIPVEQQASLRGEDGPPSPPGAPGWQDDPATAEAPAVRQLSEHWLDAAGNALFAPPGTVPIRRPKPEDALRRGVKKRAPPSPLGNTALAPGPEAPPPAVVGSQYHYHAVCQLRILSRGGFALHSVYKNPLHSGQHFNLSQQWYIGAEGWFTPSSNIPTGNVQTVEPIWTVNPFQNGHHEPALQTFSTPDGYTGDNIWGVGPGSGFVQTNNLWAIAGALAPLSAIGGTQRVLGLAAFLTDAKWWVYAGGKAPENAVGYYPNSWWNGGPMAAGAHKVDFGGEVAGFTEDDGVQYFGGMGSGQRVGTGSWRHIAYIRHMQYFDMQGTAQVYKRSDGSPVTPAVSHDGYSAATQLYAPEWNSTLFYGGPGGTAS